MFNKHFTQNAQFELHQILTDNKSPVFEVAARRRARGPRNRGSFPGGDRNIICSSQLHHRPYSLQWVRGTGYGERLTWYGERVRRTGMGYVVRGTGYGVRGNGYGVRGTWDWLRGTGYGVRGTGYRVQGKIRVRGFPQKSRTRRADDY